MSPIPSVATAFALSTAAPSVAFDPDSAGKSPSAMSQHLLGTGGLLFAVVAIVSVAAYFYRGRGGANSASTSNTWTSFTSFLSSIRHRGSHTTPKTTGTDWPVDLEVGIEHVSMVYARFFHPTFWNLVECHPATPSAPAIYVEDEANEIPMSEPKPYGMTSFLDMDDDDDYDGDGSKPAREKLDRDVRPRARKFPPYDTSSPNNVNFTSEIIGAVVRPGAFLSVPNEPEDDLDEGPSSFDLVPDELGNDLSESTSSDSELDFSSAYDGIAVPPPETSSNARRHGIADMAGLAQSLKGAIPEDGYDLVSTISRRNDLLDMSNLVELDPGMTRGTMEQFGSLDGKSMMPNCNVGVQDSCEGFRNGWSDTNPHEASHEGMDIMRRLLAELRDPDLDCSPRALSEDTDYECEDDDDEQNAVVPLTQYLDSAGRNSLESTPSTTRTVSDVSDEGPICPLTPPKQSASNLASVPDAQKARMESPVASWFQEEAQVMSPESLYSPPLFPIKAHVRDHRGNRLLLYGWRSPLAKLPRL